jgi:hypothetical protein
VELPVDLPAAFEEVLKWVYSGEVTLPLELPEDEQQITAVLNLVHTYILADKLCMESLCHEIVDTFKAWHQKKVITPIFLSPFQDGILFDSGFRTFLIRQLAHDMHTHGLAEDPLVKFFEQGSSEAWDVVQSMRDLLQDFSGGDD